MPKSTTDDLAKKWLAEIEAASKHFKAWNASATAITKRYRDERDNSQNYSTTGENSPRMNLFWSMTETFSELIYSRVPKPDFARRFKTPNSDVGLIASDMLEAATTYLLSENNFDGAIAAAVTDYILVGRGVLWVRYSPTFSKDADDAEIVSWEEAIADYVHWSDFLHSPVRTWHEVWWISRRVLMTRDQLVARFPKVGAKVNLEYVSGVTDKDRGYVKEGASEMNKQACVWEIWDSRAKQAIWISSGYPNEPLDVLDDPLSLKGFFPAPKPIYATLTNDCLIPIPDYMQMKDQYKELDDLTGRIHMLSKALKAAGVCDASSEGLRRLLDEGVDNELIPVDNWVMFAEGGGIPGKISWLPVESIATTLALLYEGRDKIKEVLYEISGMGDVLRGISDPNETATAQTLKGKWGGIRISKRQSAVQKFARDVVRLIAEIVATQFSPETLTAMTGIQLPTRSDQQRIQMLQASGVQVPQQLTEMLEATTIDDVVDLLRDDQLRSFTLDIETDSTLAPDQQEERTARMELVTAVGAMLEQSLPTIQAVPSLAPALQELFMFALRAFKPGRSVEQAFEKSFSEASQQAAQAAQQGPQPSAETELAQQMLKVQQEKDQAHSQVEAGKLVLQSEKQQSDAAAAAGRLQLDAAIADKSHAMEVAKLAASQISAANDSDERAQVRESEAQQAAEERASQMPNGQ